MSHTDLHAKTEALAAKPLTYQKIQEQGPAQPETPDESEDQKLGIKIKTLLKGDDCEKSCRLHTWPCRSVKKSDG